ncbi:MAG: lytic murein transglycosylase [Candidatus Jorgensenbacteria bacterium]|nr:lytic murein transglycosylase [Candidatus Jorgensenbacteria bacterium]
MQSAQKNLWMLGLIFVCAAALLFSVFLGAPTTQAQSASNSQSTQDQRSALEAQLAELEKQEAEYEKTVAKYQTQGKTLKGEISVLTAKISQLKKQITTVTLNLQKINEEITATQQNINKTENKIGDHLNAIASALRSLNEADRESLLTIMMANRQLSDFFGDITNVVLVQQSIKTALDEIIKLREELLQQKEQLSNERTDAENLRLIRLSQQKQIEVTQKEKTKILTVTKGKESEYQKLLKKTQESAAQIRSRIFELLGGGELTFEKAYNYAKLAESATGVRAALTLAILDRESLLGKNVGRCNYQTAMHPTRDIPYFLDLLRRLGIDPNSAAASVSCPISAHGSYGGAMGPAQFIPSTWKLYETEISKITSNNPANPWNNSDAFVATGLYIQDLEASDSCKSYANANSATLPRQTLIERCAAAKYYSGSSWYTYRFWYGQPVVDKANKFQQDINVLTGA